MRRSRSRDDGMVLIITLWVLTILAVLALTFASTMHVESRAAHNEMERARATYAARAGIERAIAAYQSDQTGYFSSLSEWAYLDSEEDEFPFPDDERYEVLVTDESSKLDVNVVDEESLSQLTQLTPELMACILDWRDEDDETRRDGAEADHYARLRPPRICANRPFMTMQELLLVAGMTDETYYGSRANRPMAIRSPSEQSESEEILPLESIFTVYGGMNDQDAQGRDRVNINVAEEDDISEIAGEVLTSSDISAIINRRGSRPFQSIGELLQVPGMTREKMQQVADLVTTRSQPGEDENAQPGEAQPEEEPAPQIPGLPGVPGQGGAVPGLPGLPSIPGDAARQFQPPTGGGGGIPGLPQPGQPGQPGQQTGPQQPGQGGGGSEGDTADLPAPDEYRHGVYNINTAPAEVLATLEGMDEQLVQAIIEERENEPFGSRGDLLRLDDVSDQVFTQIVEDISARSSSLRITSVGSLEEGRIRVKLTVIVDLKSDEPQIVHIVEG